MKTKRLLFILISIIISVSFISCSKDDDNKTDNEYSKNEENVRYYVKYELNSYTFHMKETRTITYNTDKGMETINIQASGRDYNWEGTYGPVSKDFIPSLSCEVNNYTYEKSFSGRIYVSREKEPFVIKAEGSSSSKLVLSCKIDF